MPFEIVRNDITNMHVDAIVNTANPRPVIGSGTDNQQYWDEEYDGTLESIPEEYRLTRKELL